MITRYVMDKFVEFRQKILDILSDNPIGMTTSDIGKKTGLSRVATAKYLEMMKLMGLVDYRTIGPSKVYTISETSNYTYTVRGRKEVYQVLERMTNKAKTEVDCLTTENGLVRLGKYLSEKLIADSKRGIRLKVAAPVTKSNLSAAKELNKYAEIKHVPPTFFILQCQIRDGEAAMLIITPNDDVSDSGADIGIMLKQDFATFLKESFDITWKQLVPFDQRVKEL